VKKRRIALCLVLTLLVTGSIGVTESLYDQLLKDAPEGNQVLTIWVQTDIRTFNIVARAYEEQHPGVTVDVVSTMDTAGALEEYIEKVSAAIVGGGGVDIATLGALPVDKYLKSGMIVDLNTLIDADPDFDRADYFDNVLRALEVNGQLPYVSAHFLAYTVCLNKTVSEEVQRAFEETETIDLYQAYTWYLTEKALKGDRPFIIGTRILHRAIVEWEWYEYVDVKTGVVRFDDPSFRDCLAALSVLVDTKRGLGNWEGELEELFNHSTKYTTEYLFDYSRSLATQAKRFLAYEEDPFTEPKLVKSTGGKVQAWTVRGYGIPANSANRELAWDFLKFYMNYIPDPSDPFSLDAFPINRAYFENRTKKDIYERIMSMAERAGVPGKGEAAFEEAYEKLLALVDQINYVPVTDLAFQSAVSNYIFQYIDGEVGAEEAIDLLQSKSEIYMNE